MNSDNPYGDDGGARVGKPDTPKRDNLKGGNDGGNTGAGKEAVRGKPNDATDASSSGVRSGQLEDHGPEKESGYGGSMGEPKTSSDQR